MSTTVATARFWYHRWALYRTRESFQSPGHKASTRLRTSPLKPQNGLSGPPSHADKFSPFLLSALARSGGRCYYYCFGFDPQLGTTQLPSGHPPTVSPVAILLRFLPSAPMTKRSKLWSEFIRSLTNVIPAPSGE
jgi:hypothetical protein